MSYKRCIGMILAGGQGSRLGVLTRTVAKPAVSFGAKYKIIDFALSNCTHSGIDTVGVLTQYQPLELNTYIGNGQPWDLDRNNGGVYVLPPYVKAEKGEWYKGTANAIYQNIDFIDQYSPDYVLILSGDHIYKMDYGKMLNELIEEHAAASIAVIPVPWEEASRFGIMKTDERKRIVEFAEKPAKPKSNLASMGVYIFRWDVLKKYLIMDENNSKSSNDFGKNIIPAMLGAGEDIISHEFGGYWKDVGTIQSLWEANMDLLNKADEIKLYDNDWKVFSRNPEMPPHYIAPEAIVRNSFLTVGSDVSGEVVNSIIFEGVKVCEGARIHDSIIMQNAVIEAGAKVSKTIVGAGAVIMADAEIGSDDGVTESFLSDMCSDDITLIADNITIDRNVKIGKNCMVDKDVFLGGSELKMAKSDGETKKIS